MSTYTTYKDTWLHIHGGTEIEFSDDPSQNYYGGTQAEGFLSNKQDIVGVLDGPASSDDPVSYLFIPYHSVDNWSVTVGQEESERPTDTFCGDEALPGKVIYTNNALLFNGNIEGVYARAVVSDIWPTCGASIEYPSEIHVVFDGQMYTLPLIDEAEPGVLKAYGEWNDGPVFDNYPIVVGVPTEYPSPEFMLPIAELNTTHSIVVSGDFQCV